MGGGGGGEVSAQQATVAEGLSAPKKGPRDVIYVPPILLQIYSAHFSRNSSRMRRKTNSDSEKEHLIDEEDTGQNSDESLSRVKSPKKNPTDSDENLETKGSGGSQPMKTFSPRARDQMSPVDDTRDQRSVL